MNTRGRRVSIALGAAAAVLIIIGIGQWRGFYIRYTLWRLDRADSWEKASPLLEVLAAHAGRLDDPRFLVDRLGAAHQVYTFWFFAALQHEPSRIALRPKSEEPFRGLRARLEGDPELTAMWIQFLCWRRDPAFLHRRKESTEAALALLDFARIKQMTDRDEERQAYFRWVSENLTLADRINTSPPPELPFPGWSGPVFTVPADSPGPGKVPASSTPGGSSP